MCGGGGWRVKSVWCGGSRASNERLIILSVWVKNSRGCVQLPIVNKLVYVCVWLSKKSSLIHVYKFIYALRYKAAELVGYSGFYQESLVACAAPATAPPPKPSGLLILVVSPRKAILCAYRDLCAYRLPRDKKELPPLG